MKYLQKNNPTIGAQEFPLVDMAGEDIIYVYEEKVITPIQSIKFRYNGVEQKGRINLLVQESIYSPITSFTFSVMSTGSDFSYSEEGGYIGNLDSETFDNYILNQKENSVTVLIFDFTVNTRLQIQTSFTSDGTLKGSLVPSDPGVYIRYDEDRVTLNHLKKLESIDTINNGGHYDIYFNFIS